MKFALLNTDGTLFLKNGQPHFETDLLLSKQRGYAPVDESVPDDHHIIGWQLVTGVCVPTTQQNSPNRRERIEAMLRARKLEEESKPVDVGGVMFRKDLDSRIRLLEALAFSNPGDTILFKDATGEIRKLTREDLQAIGLKFQQLSKSTGATEDALRKELDAAAPEELVAMEAKIAEFAEVTKK